MFEYDFMRHAFAAATIVAIVAGTTGYFLVLRGQTFAGHALSHVGFTGATAAVLVGAPPLWGLVIMTVAAGICMGMLGEQLAQRDVAIGLVLAFSLALGLLFLSFFTAYATQATTLLFGNVLSVDVRTVWALLGLAVVTLAILAVIARPLLFATLQPDLAEAKGVSLRRYSVWFMIVVALTTSQAAQIVGVLLVFALMVGPAAAAQRFTSALAGGVALSAGLAVLEAWAGIALAYQTDWPSSFWIVSLSVLIYAISLAVSNRRAPLSSRV